jgi:hypothetical protein
MKAARKFSLQNSKKDAFPTKPLHSKKEEKKEKAPSPECPPGPPPDPSPLQTPHP